MIAPVVVLALVVTLSRAYFIKESKEGSTVQVPSYAVGGASAFQSPFRGKACEATCPGWEEGMIGYNLPSDEDKDFIMDELICSGKGTCLLNNKGTSQCACEDGYVSGIDGNCEFVCPGAFTAEGLVVVMEPVLQSIQAQQKFL